MLLHDDKIDVDKPVLDIYLERGNHRHPVFSMSQYGLHFKDQIGKWVQVRYRICVLLIICVECKLIDVYFKLFQIMFATNYRYTLNLKELSMEDKKNRKDKMIERHHDWGGNWNLSFTLRAGSVNAQEKGVNLNLIKLTGNVVAETLKEHFDRTTTTTTTSQPTSTLPSPSILPTNESPVKNSQIFGTRGAEIFMIILVLLLGAALIVLTIKYVQLRDKLKEEFKLNGLENVNPAYDNPMYGGQRSPERYNKIDSIPYIHNSHNRE